MTEKIITDNHSEPLRVRLGEPFDLRPNFATPVDWDEEWKDLWTQPLTIELTGPGEVVIDQNPALKKKELKKGNTPLGPLNFDPKNPPIELKVQIESLPGVVINNYSCELQYGNLTLRGIPDIDRRGVQQEGFSFLLFSQWVNPESKDIPEASYFPAEPEILKNIRIVLRSTPLF